MDRVLLLPIPGCSTQQVRAGGGEGRWLEERDHGVWEKDQRAQEVAWAGWKGEGGALRLMEGGAWKLPVPAAPVPRRKLPVQLLDWPKQEQHFYSEWLLSAWDPALCLWSGPELCGPCPAL